MDEFTTRDGIGDERGAWSRICVRLRDIRYDSRNHGLDARLSALVTATEQGTARLSQWHQLLADIAERIGQAEEFGGRGDDAGSQGGSARSAQPGRTCPRGLCDRWVAESYLATPRCELFGEALATPDTRHEHPAW